MPVLERMAEIGLPLCVHGEVTDPEVDIFDREAVFIERVLAPLRERLPELRIVMEHVTTAEGVAFVEAAAANVGGDDHRPPPDPEPERTCSSAASGRTSTACRWSSASAHRLALRRAATGGDPRFFLGTDSAPHARGAKEAACGCAGVFSAPVALAWLAQVFEEEGALDRLEGFASLQRPGVLRPAAERGAGCTLERRGRAGRRCRRRSRPAPGRWWCSTRGAPLCWRVTGLRGKIACSATAFRPTRRWRG